MSQYDEDPWVRPDWAKWQAEKKGRLWHVVALACNYDPINFKFFDFEELSNYFGPQHPSDFEALLTLAKSNLGGNLKVLKINKDALEESEVSFPAFFSWLKATGYELPSELLSSVNNKATPLTEDAPLGERERTTLLTLIAALCDSADIDIKKPAKAASIIEGLTLRIGSKVASRTIVEHLKRIPAALEKRQT